MSLTPQQAELADILVATGAMQFGAFRLKLHETNPSAPLSPMYFNLRLLRSFPEHLSSTARILADYSKQFTFDLLADIPTAATPIVTMMSHHLGVPMVSPRKAKKGYGAENDLDGVFSPGQRVLLVDDLITAGTSKFDTFDQITANGLVVAGLLVALDREQGGAASVREHGVPFASVLQLHPLLTYYAESGTLSREKYAEILRYLETA